MNEFSRLSLVSLLAACSAMGQLPSAPQSPKTQDAIPRFMIAFEKRQAIEGVQATPAIQLPFQCASDGSIFVNFISTAPEAAGAPRRFLPAELVSISPSGAGKTFLLDQVAAPRVSGEIGHYASDEAVYFLVRAMKESPQQSQQKIYLLKFSREGRLESSSEFSAEFRVDTFGVFRSGALLVSGHDKDDKAPRLAIVKEDGTPLEFVKIPEGDAPSSLAAPSNSSNPGVIRPARLVSNGLSFIVIPSSAGFPLLEVAESGEVKPIRPKWPEKDQIPFVLPSDHGLFATGASESGQFSQQIYEIDPEDGSLLRRFDLPPHRIGSDVACIHENKFLSIDFGSGKVVPLIGTASPYSE